MLMRTKMEGDVLIFEFEGHLDFETTLKLHETCQEIIVQNNASQVVFNMERLKFVGSSGISQFVKAIGQFNTAKINKPKLCAVSIEFEKIFRALQTVRNPFEIFDTEEEAIEAIKNPNFKPLPRKKKLSQ